MTSPTHLSMSHEGKETLTAEEITQQWGERCPDFDGDCACCQMWAMHDEIKRVEKERDEFAALFERRWETDQRAKKRWQDAHPDQPSTWPSRDDLLVWLMGELSTARLTALLEAAEIAENFHFMKDIEWWLNSTKKEVSSETCLLLAADLRAKAEGHGQ